MKEQILQRIMNGELENLEKMIEEYHNKMPYDTDIWLLLGVCKYFKEEYEKAYEYLNVAEEENPYDPDVYYMITNTLYQLKNYIGAIEYGVKSQIYKKSLSNSECIFYDENLCREIVKLSWKENENNINQAPPQEKKLLIKNAQNLCKKIEQDFYIISNIIQDERNYVGESLNTDNDKELFAGYFMNSDCNYFDEKSDRSIAATTNEFLEVAFEGTELEVSVEEPIVLPILAKSEQTIMCMANREKEKTSIVEYFKNKFDYIRLHEDVYIKTDKQVVVGRPIKLKENPENKKLVISLFVDGLSQKIIDEEGFESVMPNAHRFFKEGLICKNFFANSDWTYPSIASYSTGLSTMRHKMFHPKINQKLPKNVKTLFEHMKDKGYYTACINGNWRVAGSDGYFRGIDRTISRHQSIGFKADQVICTAIEHMETFKETNRYVWMSLGDLHDIADGYPLFGSVAVATNYKDRRFEEKSETSVKQNYSIQKRELYIKQLKVMDRWLAILFNYLEANYKEDEYLITMFGDHGQRYLKKPNEHHLSRAHANVGFMARGCGLKGVSDEYMSSLDYTSIICKLLNAKMPEEIIDGSLPRTFGGIEKEYTYTETIHPDDSYMASIHSKDYIYYFTTEEKVHDNFKIMRGPYHAELRNAKGEIIEDMEKEKYFENIVFEHIGKLFYY